jgi:hypothetical protein
MNPRLAAQVRQNRGVQGMEPGIEPWAQSMASVVGGAEAPRFDSMAPGTTLPGLEQMTITRAAELATGAIGKYQNMPEFLVDRARKANLNPDTALYNRENQGKIFMVTLRDKGITEELAKRDPIKTQILLSQVYAGVPVPIKIKKGAYGKYPVVDLEAGESFYKGVGNNQATVSNEETQRMLRSIAQ